MSCYFPPLPTEGTTISVKLHDGSTVRLSKMAADYDPEDRAAVHAKLQEIQGRGEVPTGLLYLDPTSSDMFTAVMW